MKSDRRAIASAAGAALVTLSVSLYSPQSADAQVWGYSPYTGASTWLSLARGLSYPLSRISGAYTPFYLANNLIYAGSYAASQRLLGNPRQANYGTYTDDEPYYDPRQRTRPNFSGGYGTNDQVVHATWKKQRQQAAQQEEDEDNVPVPQQQGQLQSNSNDWLTQPIQPGPGGAPSLGVANNGAPNMVPAVSDEMPPVAPSVSVPTTRIHTSEPLAMGFVQVINDRFNGDVAAALRDKDLRKYARSVGLIDSDKGAADNISREKADLIRAIMADKHESASVKINAVRVLLKH